MTVRGAGLQTPAPPTRALPPPRCLFLLFTLFPVSSLPPSSRMPVPVFSPLLSLHPAVFPLPPLSFLSISPPPHLLPSPSPPPRTPQLSCIHKLSPRSSGGPSWASPSVCLSIPSWAPTPSQEAANWEAGPVQLGAQRQASESELLTLSAPRRAGKSKSQVWAWGAKGKGRVLGRIFCFVFFMTIYNFAFLPSAPASLAPRCVPH